jgi:hypothetical protein
MATPAQAFAKAHLILTVVWALLAIPTVIWWPESILWVALISVYANFAAHFSAYQGSRAEKKEEEEE